MGAASQADTQGMGPELIALFVLFAVPVALDAPVAPVVAWEDLASVPDGHLGEVVQLRIQAHSRPQTWEPFLTRFSPDDYVCLRAWSDAQLPWVEEHYHAPQVIVFARRGSPSAEVLAGARPHERLAIGCVPRAFQAGHLWIEVVGACRTRRQLPEGSVLHVEKALELLGREAPALARQQLERALAAPLPRHAAAVIDALVVRCDRALQAAQARAAGFRPGR
jgi:hypothetical protein